MAEMKVTPVTPFKHTMVLDPKNGRAVCQTISDPVTKAAQDQLKAESVVVQHSKSLLSKIIDVRRPNVALGTILFGTILGGVLGVAVNDNEAARRRDERITNLDAAGNNALAGLITSIAGTAFGYLLVHNPKATVLSTMCIAFLTFTTHNTVGIFEDISRDKLKKPALIKVINVIAPIFVLNVISAILFQRPISK